MTQVPNNHSVIMALNTRRKFLKLVGRAGGVAAVYATMKAMGLLHSPTGAAERPKLPLGAGTGIKVAILGAGIAGMTAAYELSQAGYDCNVFEARKRAGGRCWTIRSGNTIEELDSKQICRFDADPKLYLNLGPARIPHHHTAILSYCKEFGVPLQVLVNENRRAYFQDDKAFDGKAILNRRVVNDTRGYIAELLAKAINQKALDEDISAEDKERLLQLVRSFGALREDYSYKGSPRAGYIEPPQADFNSGELFKPLDFSELLKSDFWVYKLNFAEGYNQAATMLEPVGGMDRIAQAFASKLGKKIKYNAEVKEIRKTGQGVRIVYTDNKSNSQKALEADYAICTLPLSVLAKIETDFSAKFKQAIAKGTYVKAVKVGFQARRRFWEEDHQIYGGISWTERDITQIWYPSAGFHEDKGILLGAYIWTDSIGEEWGKLTPTQRINKAIEDGEKIHPDYRNEVLPSKAISIAWDKIPYSLGGWAEWDDNTRQTSYKVLNEPDGTIYFAGEHLSYLTAWQEGAVLSAYQAIRNLSSRTLTTKS